MFVCFAFQVSINFGVIAGGDCCVRVSHRLFSKWPLITRCLVIWTINKISDFRPPTSSRVHKWRSVSRVQSRPQGDLTMDESIGRSNKAIDLWTPARHKTCNWKCCFDIFAWIFCAIYGRSRNAVDDVDRFHGTRNRKEKNWVLPAYSEMSSGNYPN